MKGSESTNGSSKPVVIVSMQQNEKKEANQVDALKHERAMLISQLEETLQFADFLTQAVVVYRKLVKDL